MVFKALKVLLVAKRNLFHRFCLPTQSTLYRFVFLEKFFDFSFARVSAISPSRILPLPLGAILPTHPECDSNRVKHLKQAVQVHNGDFNKRNSIEGNMSRNSSNIFFCHKCGCLFLFCSCDTCVFRR